MAFRIIVIGGANADIAGVPSSDLIPKDSNIGKITVRPGGVARNIAENLVKLGASVSLVTAFGNDVYGDFLKYSCNELGIDISLSKTVAKKSSSIYMYIADVNGDMALAANDMDIIEDIDPEYLSGIDINSYDACVIDANLSESSIGYICENVSVPLYADPVSTVKAQKFANYHFTAIKPNELESSLFSPGCADRIYTSLGRNGMHASDGEHQIHVKAVITDVKNTTGAGDAAMAAIVFGELSGYALDKTAEFAVSYSAKIIGEDI